MIGAADCHGFVIPACDIVLHRYREKDEEKPVDADRFVEYVGNMSVPVLGILQDRNHIVVIMDNCSIHLDINFSSV